MDTQPRASGSPLLAESKPARKGATVGLVLRTRTRISVVPGSLESPGALARSLWGGGGRACGFDISFSMWCLIYKEVVLTYIYSMAATPSEFQKVIFNVLFKII